MQRSPIGRGGDAGLPPTQPARPANLLPQRRRLALGSLGVLALAAIVAAVIWLPALLPTPRAHSSGPGLTVATRTPANDYTVPGWTVASVQVGPALSFAARQFHRAYACGPLPGSAASIAVATSSDDGQTWTTASFPAQATLCSVTIDPVNGNRAILAMNTCDTSGACLPGMNRAFLTTDAGATWQPVPLPPDADIAASVPFDIGSIGWDFGGFCLGITITTTPQTARVACAGAASTLAWVTTPLPTTGDTINLFGTPNALFAAAQPSSSALPPTYAVSRDRGVTWRPFAPSANGVALRLLATSDDGALLLAQADSQPKAPYFVSADAGATWQPYPALPFDQQSLGFVALASGGQLIVVERNASGTVQLLIASPGTNAAPWAVYAPHLPADSVHFTIREDPNGYPVELWTAVPNQATPPSYTMIFFTAGPTS